MTSQTELIPGQPPADPPKKHAPRAVINRLLEGARDLEGDAIGLMVKRDAKSMDEAHTAMDVARSLTVAAKWLEGGQ